MIKATKNLIRQGFRLLSTTHIVLEMKSIASKINSEGYKFEPAKWENPAWVGRHLRTYDLVDTNALHNRHWLFGKSLRIYPVKNKILDEILNENSVDRKLLERLPLDFCRGCETCAYRLVGCPIMKPRLAAEGKNLI